jgi:LacI family transcriptional regulator
VTQRRFVPGLKDVARTAGVSMTTVSRYLNADLVLPADTAQRIDAAIRQLGYVPNLHARSLGRGRSDTVGLVIPDIANPFFAMLAAAVEQAAEAKGLGVLLSATSNSANRELQYVTRMRRNQVSGLLFVSAHHHTSELAQALNDTRGLVLIDEDIPGVQCAKVLCDNYRGGWLAGEHLTQHGHRRIAFIGGPSELASTRERFAGLRDAAAAAGAAIAFELYGAYSAAQGEDAARALLSVGRPPTAVFVSSGEIAFGLLDALNRAGVAVPARLSLVVFDDAGPLHLFNPPLTAIRQPIAEMGTRAVDLVLAASHGDAAQPEVRLPVELVKRASVAPPSSTSSALFA